MESILCNTTLVLNSCDNISALRQASIHSEAVKSQWKQADLIFHLSDTFQSIESVISLVHIYGHKNIGKPASTLTPLASINIRLDALVEHIMASFILSLATRNKIAVVLSDPYGTPSLYIHRVPVQYNLVQYMV